MLFLIVVCEFDHVHEGRYPVGSSVVQHVVILRHDTSCCDENDAACHAAPYNAAWRCIRCERCLTRVYITTPC